MKAFFAKIGAAIKAHKGRTVAISVTAFVLVCIIISLCCLNAFLFNRFSEGFIPTEEQLAVAEGQYKRVIIIGVDGVGDYFDHIYSPNFDTMFDTSNNASVTYTGVSVYPTISCENWMSMFHGVRPIEHGFIFRSTNQRVENGEHTDEQKYPSFMGQFLKENPTAEILSVCTWRGVNNGIIEDSEQITKYNSYVQDITQFVENYNPAGTNILTVVDASQEAKVNAVVRDDIPGISPLKEYLDTQIMLYGSADETIEMRDAMTMQRIISETVSNPDKYAIAYMHLDQVDHAGHSFGYSKPGYVNAVSRVDNLIGRLYDAYETAGLLEDTLFILCTDHGHRYAGGHKNHGKNTDEEVNITFAIAGKTVKAGMLDGKYVNTDLPAIVSYVLGVKASENWQGRVPYNMFKD